MSLCAARWNLGTTRAMIWSSRRAALSRGKSLRRFRRLMLHWHMMSYEATFLVSRLWEVLLTTT